MGLLFCDGADHESTSTLLGKWASYTGTAPSIASPGRNTGQTYNSYISIPGQATFSKAVANSGTLTAGFAFQAGTAPSSAQNICAFYDNSSMQVAFKWQPSGQIEVVNGAGTVLGSTTSGLIPLGTFTYIEVQCTFSNSSGSVGIQVNGASQLSVTGVDTSNSGNSYANIVTIYGGPSLTVAYGYDDIYICDGTGSYNNTFLGDVRIGLYLPYAAGYSTQWTPSTGSNYTCVDTVPPSTAKNVSSSTVGQIDSYEIQPQPSTTPTPSAIVAVQLVAYAEKTDSASRVIGLGFGNSSTAVFDSGHSLTNSYVFYTSPLNTNPITSAAWAATDLASAQIALKVIS